MRRILNTNYLPQTHIQSPQHIANIRTMQRRNGERAAQKAILNLGLMCLRIHTQAKSQSWLRKLEILVHTNRQPIISQLKLSRNLSFSAIGPTNHPTINPKHGRASVHQPDAKYLASSPLRMRVALTIARLLNRQTTPSIPPSRGSSTTCTSYTILSAIPVKSL